MTNSQPPSITDAPKIPVTTGQRPAHRWPRLWGRRMWLLLALSGLLLIYRLAVVRYSGISLFFDEAQYWDWSRQLQWGYYSKPPVIAGMIAVSTAVFGDGVIGVKLLSMLSYIGTAVAMVGLSRALWPTSSGVRTGVIAGGLFLTAPLVGLLGMFASTDAPLLMCWTLAAWALWRAQVTNRVGLWLLCGVLCGLGLLSKYTMAAFAITALWTLWGVQGPKRGLVRVGPWLALAAALLVLSPNLVWNAKMGFPTLLHTAEITTRSSRDGGPASALIFFVGQILMMGPVAVIAALWLNRKMRNAPSDVASASQWASSSQMLPPSQWAASTQQGSLATATPSTLNDPQASELASLQPDASEPARKRSASMRSSAYYLASVTSYRFLVALSVPLILLALGQALMADAHLNWAAPATIGLFLLLATRMSPPLVPLAVKRPNAWFWAAIATNLLLTGAAIHARDILGDRLPSKFDVLVRMRGWESAFSQLDSLLDDPRVQGLPVVTDTRVLLTQSAYHLRRHKPRIMAWNPKGTHNDHYQLQHSMPNTVGQDVLILSESAKPDHMMSRFAFVRELGHSAVSVGSDRQLQLHLFLARGFVGYDNASYEEQSGTAGNQSEDTPFTRQPKP
jgi:4-amino-4-deoxy-L-arabinose transferase-like glycosyltransferase